MCAVRRVGNGAPSSLASRLVRALPSLPPPSSSLLAGLLPSFDNVLLLDDAVPSFDNAALPPRRCLLRRRRPFLPSTMPPPSVTSTTSTFLRRHRPFLDDTTPRRPRFKTIKTPQAFNILSSFETPSRFKTLRHINLQDFQDAVKLEDLQDASSFKLKQDHPRLQTSTPQDLKTPQAFKLQARPRWDPAQEQDEAQDPQGQDPQDENIFKLQDLKTPSRFKSAIYLKPSSFKTQDVAKTQVTSSLHILKSTQDLGGIPRKSKTPQVQDPQDASFKSTISLGGSRPRWEPFKTPKPLKTRKTSSLSGNPSLGN
ncbi:hypothetical protein B0H17DRAFT_1208572 [Mycena rosella]|uniref:Uncharacterized protein n=1 Tax=Mycena rosella TaxID=1033263 RepID=A0AAD7G9G5_MYCRO|nr:hypothetical protein B0H17DRAFT_1208572 [Mycena rosella]